MDEELLYQRLKRLENQGDRAVFREMAKVFTEVVRYSREQMERLEEKIDREWKDPLDKRYIYGTVMAKRDAAFVDHLFFPMAEEPKDSENLLGTLFLQLPDIEIQKRLEGSYLAQVITESGSYRLKVQLQIAGRYRQAMEKLREDFYFNRIYFGNANLPYIDKFVDVILVEPEEWDKSHIISDLKLEGLEDKASYGVIPLWNVRKRLLPCAVFPVPAEDTAYFEHEVVFPQIEDGYVLCTDPEINSIFYRDNTILLWSKRELAKKWEVNQLVSPEDKVLAVPHWPITTNKRSMTHSQRQAEAAVRLPRTKGEMMRILHSYQTVSAFEAEEKIEIGIPYHSGRISLEEPLAGELAEEMWKIGDRTRVLIRFKADEGSFILRDEIRFLLRELCSFFPEYKFEGELC